jgi:hypothetical protein
MAVLRAVFGGPFLPEAGDPRLDVSLEERLMHFARMCDRASAPVPRFVSSPPDAAAIPRRS